MKNTDILDQIDALARERPFRPESIAKVTGLALAPVQAGSNAYFTVYRSDKAAKPFRSAEVRSPTAKSDKAGLVIVDLEIDCLKLGDIGDRWGKGEWTGAKSPSMPADRPDYYQFKQPWGLLKLGFHPETGCLVAAVLDGTSK